MEKLDMELTPEREEKIKERLLRLYAHQNGLDYDSMKVTIIKKDETA